MKIKNIPFSPPDITQDEIDEVTKVLKSGWITTGPKTMEFEKNISEYLGVNKALTVSSATAAMEIILKGLNIGGDDEYITTPYTYTATSSVALHRGIRPKFVDIKKGSFLIDIDKLYDAITPKTRVIATVDFAGVPVDYDAVRAVLKAKNREDIMLLSDSAHAFGAKYKGKRVGSQYDFHAFSFHAIKNLTTAEGGVLTFNNNNYGGKEDLFKELKITSLHGQSKDALSKMKAGAWKYDIINDGMKCNMTDIQSAIGVVQLKRYDSILEKRANLFHIYADALKNKEWAIIPFEKENDTVTSYHIFPLRIKDFDDKKRSTLIQMLADEGIATNVHFIPLPMFTAYKNLGYKIEDYPNAYEAFESEITLPLYSKLAPEDAEYVVSEVIRLAEKIMRQ